MITPEERNRLVSMRMQQAELAIQRVESCLTDDEPEIAANRIYYGMFYAMLALALLHNFESSKHQQMIGWFNKNFVQDREIAYPTLLDTDHKYFDTLRLQGVPVLVLVEAKSGKVLYVSYGKTENLEQELRAEIEKRL
jgi:uncharacterized protein (UPF0332 family)